MSASAIDSALRRAARLVPAVAGAALLAAATSVSLLAASKADPWARVPALTTSCYQSSDDFHRKLATADESLTHDLERQEAINTSISEQIRTIDPMTLASRQQQYMMEHPQEAMELMQRNQQLGETLANSELADAEKSLQLDQELAAIDARYEAALDGALAPIKAKHEDLERRAGKDASIQNEAGAYEGWALQEFLGLLKQENAAYEKLCAEWWAASGPYHAWLKRYREHLVETIPRREEAESVGAGFIATVLSTPEATWQPTAALRSVNEYADRISRVFAKRRAEPVKPMPGSASALP